MIKLKDILSEQVAKTPETIAQIWDGRLLKFGEGDSTLVRKIQSKAKQVLATKYPDAAALLVPDGDFGPGTVEAIAKILGVAVKNPETFRIGPKTLEALGFNRPDQLSLDTKILAATITGEGMGSAEDMLAIANVILNRSVARNIKTTDIALERKQFSMWNQITGSSISEKTQRVIDNWGGGLKSAGNIDYWNYGVKLAKQVQNRSLSDNTGGATHYFTGVRPYWAKGPTYKLHKIIGKHEYGRDMKVSWGEKPVSR